MVGERAFVTLLFAIDTDEAFSDAHPQPSYGIAYEKAHPGVLHMRVKCTASLNYFMRYYRTMHKTLYFATECGMAR